MKRASSETRLATRRKAPLTGIRVIPIPFVLARREVAGLLGRSPSWFDRWIKTKEGAEIFAGSRLIGGRRVYKTEAVLRFVEEART